jgi:hypothetical protein
VCWLYRILFQRLPSRDELALARSFLHDVQADVAVPEVELASAAPTGKNGRKNDKRAQVQNQRRQNTRFGAIQNPGEFVEKRPLTGWEAYAQALLFSNELAYVN